jgi:hypothetical protein
MMQKAAVKIATRRKHAPPIIPPSSALVSPLLLTAAVDVADVFGIALS